VVFDVQDPAALEAALASHPDLGRDDEDGSYAWTEDTGDFRRGLGTFIPKGGRLVLEMEGILDAVAGDRAPAFYGDEERGIPASDLVGETVARRPTDPAPRRFRVATRLKPSWPDAIFPHARAVGRRRARSAAAARKGCSAGAANPSAALGESRQSRRREECMSAGSTTSAVSIRPARPAEDAAAIATIYNQGIEDRLATLETQLRSPDERRQWMAARGTRHPVIVAETAGVVVGWGSLNQFNPRPAYDHVADLSVYIERAWRGRGVGRRLIERLVALGTEIGYHKIVLAAFPFNEAGMALYRRMGFTTVGIYHEQGLLDGKWVDVIVMERLL
jgi:phosphinothricin acetyltransferase